MHEEKEECQRDYEQKRLVMSNEKCKNCDCYYKCCFVAWEMDSIVNGE